MPGMCFIFTVKLFSAAMKKILRTRDIIFAHFDVPVAHMFVIAMLSQ